MCLLFTMCQIIAMLEESRRDLEYLIEACNGNLLDPFVIAASQKLDNLIKIYNDVAIQ